MPKAIRNQIISAFTDHPKPSGRVAVDTYDDEGTEEYFAGQSWQALQAEGLRAHHVSLCFLTPEALAYYWPAFMLAEIDAPDTADVIADELAGHVLGGAYNLCLAEFSREELLATIAFFELCATRYPDGVYDLLFRDAADRIRQLM